ncbi:ABC transporter [Actinomyces bowdenii]|uniref:ABC transporter n=1 Tax=Actinomyces bowdenii TaxID=131109 RepID=A0A3P1V819_9ACTO|nr:ABC transporter [Actinomyces bowdenii]RRD30342.1 ABC transporter [Actinomyces bowdenii]
MSARDDHGPQARLLAGLGRASRIALRASWPALMAAAALGAALVLGNALSARGLYPTAAEREHYAQLMGSSTVIIAFNGRGYGLTSLGGITAYEVGFMGQLLFPMAGLILAVRLTRHEEEAGRADLLTAAPVGRLTALGTAVLLLAATAGLMAGAIIAGLTGLGLPASGCAWYAASAGACLMLFGALGCLLSQVCQLARSALRIGVGLIAAAFLARALADGFGSRAALLGPLGWLPEVRAFAEPRAWPLLAHLIAAALLLIIAGAVALHRDVGAGVLAPRPGPTAAHPRLATCAGYAWRMLRPGMLGAMALAAAWSLLLGLLGREVEEIADATPSVLLALGARRGTDVLVMLATIVAAAAAAAVGVQAGTRLAAEEGAGRLAGVLSTRVPRLRLWIAWWALALLGSLAVLAASCLALGLSAWMMTGQARDLSTAWGVAVSYAAPIAAVVALCSALGALGPRWPALGWAVVGWILTVGFLGEALDLPQWARDLSPLHLVGTQPLQDLSMPAVAGLGAAAAALLAASTAVFRRRDLTAG